MSKQMYQNFQDTQDDTAFDAPEVNDRHDYAVWCFENAANDLANQHGYTAEEIAAIVTRILKPTAVNQAAPVGEDPVPF